MSLILWRSSRTCTMRTKNGNGSMWLRSGFVCFSWFSFRWFTKLQHQPCQYCSNHAGGCDSWRWFFLMQMLCDELQSPKASFATTCGHFGWRFRFFAVFLHTQQVPMYHKATTMHWVRIFKFMISDADSDRESDIPKYCTKVVHAVPVITSKEL